jgi:hypothetical protein
MLPRNLGRYAMALTILACATPTGPQLEGRWGGTEASLALARSGGSLTYPCGAGTIDSTWTLTRDGRFDGTGQHFFGGGPIPPQGHPPHPARYAGQLHGSRFTFTVTLLDVPETLGPFHLIRGGPPMSEQCV